MYTEEEHLILCESLAGAARRMRLAAERADWDSLAAGGNECVALIERLRRSAASPLDNAARERKALLLREVLAHDRFIRERTQPALARLATMLSGDARTADGHDAVEC